MAPKKKAEEEKPLPAEEVLPPGFSLGCEVYWVGALLEATGSVAAVPQGSKGTLVLVHDLAQPGNKLDFADVHFEGHAEPHKVPFHGLGLEPPSQEQFTELSTGLALPLRGVDVQRMWLPSGAVDTAALREHLRLEEAYPDPARRDIVLDFHTFSLEQSRSLCFSTLQAAVFQGIMAHVLATVRSADAADGRHDIGAASRSFQEFQELIIAHASSDPPARLKIFSPAEARKLTDFATGTVFRHFLLYQYCVNCGREVEERRLVDTLERPLPPPELNMARPDRRKSAQEVAELPREQAPAAAARPDEEGASMPTEEEEVERAVRERLRETEEMLQRRLAEREEAFMAKLQDQALHKGKK